MLVLAFVLAAAVLAAGWWWVHPPDPVAELRAHRPAYVSLQRLPEPALGPRVERWRISVTGADPVLALGRDASPGAVAEHEARGAGGTAAPWTIVLLGGLQTDDRAALLVPDSLPLNALAVSWPWRGPRRMSTLRFLSELPAIRRALLDTPGAIANAVTAVRERDPRARVLLLGASLGVPPTVAALRLVRPDAVLLIDGAAGLDRLLASETATVLGNGAAARLAAPAAGALAGRLLSSLDPARHGEAARGLPMLILDAERDERYPASTVRLLHATFPHAALATHPGGHMDPGRLDEMQSIAATAWRWLERLPAGRAPAQPPPGAAPR